MENNENIPRYVYCLVCVDCNAEFTDMRKAYYHAESLSTEDEPHGGFDVELVKVPY